MRAKLTKITSSHSSLRTNSMIGEIDWLPEVGKQLVITNDEPLENKKASGRMIHTTPIVESTYDEKSKTYTFKTTNSTYKLEILGDENDSSN